MGIFGFGRKKAKEEVPEAVPETVGISRKVNLPEKAVKVKVADGEEGTLIKGVYFWEEDDKIRGLVGEKVIFEVGKRSKAFGELGEFARRKADYVVLTKKAGEYGTYYRMRVKAQFTREEAGMKA